MNTSSSRRPRAIAVAIVIATLFVAGSALAGGAMVEKWLTLEEVVERSKLVLEVKVREVDHVWATREAYGEEHRFVSEFRILVDVVSVMRGKASDYEKKAFWLIAGGKGIPGVWIVIDEEYETSYNLVAAKKGDVLLAFFKEGRTYSIEGKKKPALRLWFPEQHSFLKKVRKLVESTPPPSD